MNEQTTEVFQEWCILEIMGHRKIAGKVTEETRFGCAMLRIDIPQSEGFFTQYYNGSSIYCLTPTTEKIARAFAKGREPEPASRWELKALPQEIDPPKNYYCQCPHCGCEEVVVNEGELCEVCHGDCRPDPWDE